MDLAGDDETRGVPRARNWRCIAVAALLAAAILAAAVAVPYAYFRAGLYTKSADESARTIEAWFWTFDKSKVKIDVWLPLHTMAMGLALEVWPDLILAPRALNMLLGALLLPVLAWLAHELFRQRGAPMLTMGLAAFFGPRVVLSAVPLSEILYMLFLVLGMAAAARWLNTGRLRWVPAAAFFLGLSAGVRFEGWIFSALFGVFAAVWVYFEHAAPKPRRLAAIACAGVLLIAPPAIWCGLWYKVNGNAFGFFGLVGNRYFRVANPEHSFALLWEHGLLYQCWRQNLLSLNIAGLAGVALFLSRARRLGWWLAVPGSTFALLAALTLTGRALPTHNFWRIAAPFSVLLLPFTAYAVVRAAKVLGAWRQPLRPAMIAACVALLLAAFNYQCYRLAQGSEMDQADLEAGRFVQEQLHAHSGKGRARAFIEDIGVRTLHVKTASNDPGAFLPDAPLANLVKNGELDFDAIHAQNIAVMVIRAEWAPQFQGRLDAFSAAAMNGRWMLLVLEGTQTPTE